MKRLLKKIIPKQILDLYHRTLAVVAALVFGRPSEKLIVVGVTGTNGKSTTVDFISRILRSSGQKVGYSSTVGFKIGDKEWLNKKKMTMLGRFQLQKMLGKMVKAGCRYAVIEVSSEGVKQHRHLGINFDYAIFTNLTPEHLQAHGGFENYKEAKGIFFQHLSKRKNKKLPFGENGKMIKVPKISIINLADKQAGYFLQFQADKKVGFYLRENKDIHSYYYSKIDRELIAKDLRVSPTGTIFKLNEVKINLRILGEFNVANALPAIAVGLEEGISLEKIKKSLESIKKVPGRMEFIDQGQNFWVMVDYAPEVASMKNLYNAVKTLTEYREDQKIIHVLGSCGGGRDKDRRPVLGRLAGKNADFVIVTNEDPYDEDPQDIINQVATGAKQVGKKEGENLFKILDRKKAIAKALNLADKDDLVLITGKGAEQKMAVKNGKYI